MENKDLPQFNIGHVVEQTGVPADTLRAWERRYGFPVPQRTQGGHRLYTLGDVEGVRWLRSEVAQGTTISQAVAQWLQRQARLEDLEPQRGLQPPMDDLRAAWLEAIMAFDEAGAEEAADAAFASYPASEACAGVLEHGLSQLGEGWHASQVTVQQEHFATALVLRRMNALLAACPAPTRAQKALVACAPEEEHSYPALYLTWELRELGFPVVYLGPRVPVDDLLATVKRVQPTVVVLTASTLATAAELLKAAQLSTNGVPVYYGGGPFELFPNIRNQVPGIYLEGQLQGAGFVLEQNMRQPYAPPAQPSVNKYAGLNLRKLEREVGSVIQAMQISYPGVPTSRVGQFWSESIAAAAAFGDADVLGQELQWTAALLDGAGVPVAVLEQYLASFMKLGQHSLKAQFPEFYNDLGQVIAKQI